MECDLYAAIAPIYRPLRGSSTHRSGGMGALFLALDPAIDRLVALKLLRVDNEETRARFLREARSAGRLQHPHIVTVYDVGEHQGQPFIAMEYVKGETLGDVIGRRAPLSIVRRPPTFSSGSIESPTVTVLRFATSCLA